MTGAEIKQAIDETNAQIEKLLVNDTFVLNSEVYYLMSLNDTRRKECPHEDDGTGICKYCMADIIGD